MMRDKKAIEIRRKESGITLIALVVTIVVLLILAGITINMLFSDNGIINKAQKAADITKEKSKEDTERLKELIDKMNSSITEEKTNAVAILSEEGIDNEKEYKTLEEALNNSYNGANIYIVNNCEVAQNITVPSGVTIVNNEYKIDLKSYTMTVEGNVALGIKINASDEKAHNISQVSIGKIVGKVNTAGEGTIYDESLITNADIQVLDYINYPCEYTNILTTSADNESKSSTSTYTGWRVSINTEISEGAENNELAIEEGIENVKRFIRIVTAGTPKKCTIKPEQFVESNMRLLHQADENDPDDATIFELIDLKQEGEKYYLPKYALGYSVFGTIDVAALQNGVGCENDLVNNKSYYCINSVQMAGDGGKIAIYDGNGTSSSEIVDEGSFGIRPAINLRNDLHVVKIWNSTNETYHWEFID